MVLRLFDQLWRARRSARERDLVRERDRLTERERLDRKQRQEEKEEADDAALAVLLSDELQRFEQQLRDDLADAITATRLAVAQAEAEEQVALEALQTIEENAIVLADGRRVYFDADGRLFDEKHELFDDPSLVAEARDAIAQRRGASSYEGYRRASESCDAARARKAELAEILDRLDDLQERIDRKDLDPDELAHLREELNELVAELPEPARELYRDLQAAREHDRPTQADSKPIEALSVLSDFERAAARQTEALDHARREPDAVPDRQPVYKSVPPFE